MIIKPQSLAVAAFAALFSASAFAGGPEMLYPAPNPFNGFFVDATVSLNQTGYHMNSSLDFSKRKFFHDPSSPIETTEIASQTGGDSDVTAYGGVRVGWGKVFQGRWYGAVEGFGNFGSSKGDVTTTIFPNSQFFTASQTNDGHVGDNWGIDAKFGILLSPTTLAYTRLGAVWANIKSTVEVNEFVPSTGTNTNIVSASNSKNEAAFLWGFGVEQFVWGDTVSIFGEYTHATWGAVNTSANFPNTDTCNKCDNPEDQPRAFFTFRNSVKTELSAFTGGIAFHFRGSLANLL